MVERKVKTRQTEFSDPLRTRLGVTPLTVLGHLFEFRRIPLHRQGDLEELLADVRREQFSPL